MSRLYFCDRIQSGPLIKESRARRPRFDRDDSNDVRSEKRFAAGMIRTAVTRSPVDRLELELAALGWDAMHYVLTFRPEDLPKSYRGVRDALRGFERRARRVYACKAREMLRYVAVIEGLHEQYHIHFCVSSADLDIDEIGALWTAGLVLRAEYVLQDDTAFRGLAWYLCKERNDGVRIPLGKQQRTCSRAVTRMIGAPERWRDTDGTITPDAQAIWFSTPTGAAEEFDNGWGRFSKLTWIVPDRSKSCRRALRRMRIARRKKCEI